MRRFVAKSKVVAHAATFRAQFYAWVAFCKRDFVLGGPTPSVGYAAVAMRPLHVDTFYACRRLGAMTASAAARARRRVKPAIRDDRAAFIEGKTIEAQNASAVGDSKTTYAIVRALSGRHVSNTPLHVLKKDGVNTSTETERLERWNEHFAEVFDSTIGDIG